MNSRIMMPPNPKSVPAPTIFILRRHWLTVDVSNETDYPMDLLALNRFIAATIATWT